MTRSTNARERAIALSFEPCLAMGGTLYGMKTTLYLPDDLKKAIELEASRRSASEAEVIREALRQAFLRTRPRPSGGIIAGSEPIAERVDELLSGFGG